MKASSVVWIVIGVVLLAAAGTSASKAPNPSYLIGTFLPGLGCLALGFKFGQRKEPDAPVPPDERG